MNEDRAGPLLDESFEGGVKVALALAFTTRNSFSNSAAAACNSPI